MNGSAALGVLLRMALRNLVVHRVKSGVVGAIMFFGTFLVVSGTAMLDSVRGAMERSITSSLSANVQIYSAQAKDELALFGGPGMSAADIGEIDAYGALRDALLEVDGVKAVVPMGIAMATTFAGTEIDRILEDVRHLNERGDTASIEMRVAQLQQIAGRMRKDVEAAGAATSDRAKVEENLAVLDRVSGAGFAAELLADPVGTLDWLDNNLAPLALDGRMLYLRCIGTNLDTFPKTFDRFQIVEGDTVPPGQRGILLSKTFYEKQVKNFVARELDAIKAGLDEGKTLAGDSTLRSRLTRTATQYQRIQFQLSPKDATEVEVALRGFLGQPDTADLAMLLQAFLTMDDGNFRERYDWFYANVAPRIRLYEVPVGSVMTLRSFTKSGYIRAVNVKVYGTFQFNGLETSDLAGANNLVDMMTFRSLYGKMTEDQLDELAGIKAASGVKEVSREDAEAALFGGGSGSIEATFDAAPTGFDELAELAVNRNEDQLDETVYTTAQMENGLALTAAVVLEDPSKVPEAIEGILAKAKEKGLDVKAVDWQSASGIVGQLVMVLQAVLYTAILIIFLVALVIINNTMVMATMDRTTEIGTMRAIGAQRPFVIVLFLVETMLLGAIAGGLGAGAGALFIGWLGSVGVPAVHNTLVLLFAGPRLFPELGVGNVVFGMASILTISALSTLYPSVLAARVPPVVAMQAKE